jgi:hypothetical protein
MFDGNPMLPSDFNERRDDVLKFVLHIDGIDDPQWVTLDPSGRYTLESGEEISVSSASREEVDVAVSKILRQHVASSLDRLSELSSDSLLRTLDFVQGEELTLERAKSGR